MQSIPVARGEQSVTEESVRRHLIEQIAQRARITPEEVDVDRPLEEFGLASRDAVAIAGELEEMVGRSLPATLVWEFPTINRISVAIATGADTTPSAAAAPPVTRPVQDEPIAIVGIGCR